MAKDQFAQNMATQPAFSWTATAGTITTTGLYTAPQASAVATVTATAGAVTGTATATTTNAAPQIAQCGHGAAQSRDRHHRGAFRPGHATTAVSRT